MPTHLTLENHIHFLVLGAAALHDAAASAGQSASVATCPGWTVGELVAHIGMVHRWATSQLRGESEHDTDASLAEARGSTDPLAWFDAGVQALVDALNAAPDDLCALVFLNDAPPPRQFWGRRQCHETTMHGVDALSARLGRWPTVAEANLDPGLAADGLDELLCGFITRSAKQLRSPEPYTMLVRTTDTGHAWTLRVSDGPVTTVPGGHDNGQESDDGSADATLTGTAAALYLGLWNRSDEVTARGRKDVLDRWRSNVRITW